MSLNVPIQREEKMLKKIKNFFFSRLFIGVVFPFVVLVMVLSSSPLFAEEAAKVTDAVNAYVYNPEQPDQIHPLYVGDAIPPGAIIYLADANSRVAFNQQGQMVVLDQPGFYDTFGEPAEISEETRAQIQKLAKAESVAAVAESLAEAAKADDGVALYVNEPQNVSSPSA